jgi:FAD/FMN-containing dehydrogenase
MNKLIKIYLLSFILPLNLSYAKDQEVPSIMNDIHSQLNKTVVKDIKYPRSIQEIRNAILLAKKKGLSISISGGQHSMGGQQFGTNTLNLNMSEYDKIISFDKEKGIVEVESGIQWPKLIEWLVENQENDSKPWGIRQKQTGADDLSLGGALSSNIHGRGLTLKPIVGDIESFTLIDANGELKNCSRTENQELFKLSIGGYGLFGVIATVKLRLMPRVQVERVVEVISSEEINQKINERIKDGYLFGDFQFSIDPKSDNFLTKGVFATYKPMPEGNLKLSDTEIKELSEAQWRKLYYLAHGDKAAAYDMYVKFYQSTNGQKYWSDTHQLGVYIVGYHTQLDNDLHAQVPGTEMISEVYVPRKDLDRFLREVRSDFRKYDVNVIYGTVRFIEQDDETFLPWANKRYACIVFNFHVDHDARGMEKAKQDFTRLIDRALEFGGSYFLTYHRWARRDQVIKAYPQFPQFLALKKKYDPNQLFQSDWYRHYIGMFERKK